MNANEREYSSVIVFFVTVVPLIWEYFSPAILGLDTQNAFFVLSGFLFAATLGILHGKIAKKFYLTYPWLCCTMAGCFAMPAGYLFGQDPKSMTASILLVFIVGLPICIGEVLWEKFKPRR